MKKCQECMWDAPYNYCCKVECHEHMFCEGCQAEQVEYGYFIELESNGDMTIVYDRETRVKYYIYEATNNYRHCFGITPIYNTDGSLQIYEGE